MAERFVIGFALNLDKLAEVVGGTTTTTDLLAASAGASEDLDELLSEWGHDPPTTEEALDDITSGELRDERDYHYRRVVEILAAALGERFEEEIDVVCTYYLPNESHGRWDPVLEALGLSRLASLWGTNNTPFPWSEGKSRQDWPIITCLTPDAVAAARAELEALGEIVGAVAQLPDVILSEDGGADEANDSREELAAGLTKLVSWFERAGGENLGVLLMMDGSQ